MNRVVNATVISNFAAVGRLDILARVAGPLRLPPEVYDELVNGRLAGYGFYDNLEDHIQPFAADGWLILTGMTDEELRLSLTLPPTLHSGERACLSIARSRGWGLLTDDRAARRQGREWGIPLSGTLGALLLAVEDGIFSVEDANQLLRDMIALANYRSPVTDLNDLLP